MTLRSWICLLVIVTAAPAFRLASAAPGDLDPLDASLVGDFVYASAVQPDGKILIGGKFTSVLGVPRNHLARLNADGTLDLGFDPKPDDQVHCVAVQPDGRIVIGGTFTTWQPNGTGSPITRRYLARVNADGTLDTSFDPQANFSVWCLAVQPDGKMFVGGSFSTFWPNGGASVSRTGVARLNADGTVDATFVNVRPNGNVWTLAVQSDGRVIIGGAFTSLQPGSAASPVARGYIARLETDGTLDAGFDPKADWDVRSIIVQPDGRLLLGGFFSTLQPNGAPSATSRSKLARVNADGTLDAAFQPEPSGYVYSLGLQTDGRILAVGAFFSFAPAGHPFTSRLRIGRLNGDGSVDPGYNPGANLLVYGVTQQADGRAIVGGTFTALQPNGAPSPTTRNYLARLLSDAAPQSLAASSQGRIEWTRGGAAPEVTWATFELSTNGGASWSLLGSGVRMGATASWELTGLSLPANGLIRARGPTTGGWTSGSRGLIEQVAAFSFAPEIVVEQPSGVPLVDGVGTVALALVSNQSKTFTIRNTGNAPLTGLALSLTGDTGGVLGALGTTSLAPGQSTTFTLSKPLIVTLPFGYRTGVVSITSNDADESPFDIPITMTYIVRMSWRQTWFGTWSRYDIGSDFDDPDGDGVRNLIEFATGTNPTVATSRPGQLTVNGGVLEFTYTRANVALGECTFTVQWNNILSSAGWSSAGVIETVLSDNGVTQVIKATIPAGSGGRRFARLRITAIEDYIEEEGAPL